MEDKPASRPTATAEDREQNRRLDRHTIVLIAYGVLIVILFVLVWLLTTGKLPS